MLLIRINTCAILSIGRIKISMHMWKVKRPENNIVQPKNINSFLFFTYCISYLCFSELTKFLYIRVISASKHFMGLLIFFSSTQKFNVYNMYCIYCIIWCSVCILLLINWLYCLYVLFIMIFFIFYIKYILFSIIYIIFVFVFSLFNRMNYYINIWYFGCRINGLKRVLILGKKYTCFYHFCLSSNFIYYHFKHERLWCYATNLYLSWVSLMGLRGDWLTALKTKINHFMCERRP